MSSSRRRTPVRTRHLPSSAMNDLLVVENQLHALTWSRGVYERITAAPDTPCLSEEVRHWLWWNHYRIALVDIRRLVDHDQRSSSLVGIVRAIQDHRGAIRASVGRELPNSGEVESDIERLELIRGVIAGLASKWVAHSDRVGVPTRAPDFADLDRARGVVREVFLKYRALLTGNDSDRIGPDIEWE